MRKRLRIGEYLVQQGLLRPEDLARALELQRRTGERLGRILLALGYVRRQDFYRALSELWGMPYVYLTKTSIPTPILRRWPIELALKTRALPFRLEQNTLHVAVDHLPDDELKALLKKRFGDVELVFYITTDWDINWAIRTAYRKALLDRATFALYYRSPEESAYTVFTKGQFMVFAAAILITLVLLILYPLPTLVALNLLINIGFFVFITFKFAVSIAGALTEKWKPVTEEEVAALTDSELPRYTILVPVYKEANVIGLLMENLANLDYPKEKLEILVLIEEDDPETLEAAKASRPPDNVRFIVVPDGPPKTKPKACNVGLLFATGEYLVIYDAEDKPEPDQLKKAVAAFRKGPEHMICVQAALNYFNWDENYLTRMFTLEYSYWFDYILPGLYRLGLPIPLGGTSNHFKTEKLRELGGWDPFNVTEDADLGIRAAMHGYTVGVINSTTYEEANTRVGNWIRQRSRWIKGYMQTALVHSRRPLELLRKVGVKQFMGFFLLIAGTPLTFLISPLLWLLFGYWLFTRTHALEPYLGALPLHLQPALGQRHRDLPQHAFRLQTKALQTHSLLAYQPRLLDAPFHRRLQGPLATLHQPLLLGKDHPRPYPGQRRVMTAREEHARFRIRFSFWDLFAVFLFAAPYLALGYLAFQQNYLSNAHAGFLVKAFLAHDRGRLEIVGFSYPPLPLGLLFLYPFLQAPVFWGSLALGTIASVTFKTFWQVRSRALAFATLALLYAPVAFRLVLDDFSQAIGLMLLWLGWRQYLNWIREGITAYGFFAGLLYGAAIYATPVALPLALLSALSIGPARKLKASAWFAAATVLAFPAVVGALIWAYLAWTFTGSEVFLYEVFRYTPYAPPGVLALLFPLVAALLNPRSRHSLVPLLLTLPASYLLGFGFSQDFAFLFLSLLGLATLEPAGRSRLRVWIPRLLFLLTAFFFVYSWAQNPRLFSVTKTSLIERAIGEKLREAPEQSILTDDRTTYSFLVWSGTAKPFLVPADAGYYMALSAPERFVQYIFACPGTSDLYHRVAREAPPKFSLVWRYQGCLFFQSAEAPPLF